MAAKGFYRMNILQHLIWAAAWACAGKKNQARGGAAAAAPKDAQTRPNLGRVQNDRTPRQPSRAFENNMALRGGSSNKKYTTAAAEAMKTMNSFTVRTTRQSTVPTLHSESALMDKETNAIYWQGGADILSSSLTNPYLTQRGVLHVKATILSVLLWLWVWGNVSRYLISRYFAPSSGSVHGNKLLFMLPRKIASFITPVIQFVLLLFHSLLYLRLPQYSPNVIVIIILLYLLESYSCSTRRYLSHAMNAPEEVEAYLERIRNIKPCVTWKVRCFHYEDRELWKSVKGIRKIFGIRAKKRNKTWGRIAEGAKLLGMHLGNSHAPASTTSSGAVVESPILWATRKVITHQAVGTYKFGSWEDRTLASLWKRSESFSPTSHEAPFSKLTLSKLLVLKDKNTRDDYFAQQAAFVMLEGRKDVHAEFSTAIEVEGLRPKLLAVRSVPRAFSAALFRQHIYILFTLLGLSLPYRIWFAKHCDEVRVTVVKETGIDERLSKEAGVSQSSWFPGKWGWGLSQSSADLESKRNQEMFRKSMQQFSLYEDKPTSLDKSVQVDVDVQPETVSRVEMLCSDRVRDDDQTVQELLSISLHSPDTNLSNQTASSVDESSDLQTGTMGDNCMSDEAEDQVTDIPPESTDESIMDDVSPLKHPISDNKDGGNNN